MKNFLKKIGLNTTLTTELWMNQNTFISRLNQIVEKPSSSFFNPFSTNKKEYIGTVGYDDFKFKRSQLFNQKNQMQASVIGKVYQKGEKLIIESEITGYSNYLVFFLFLIFFFYAAFITILFSVDLQTGMPLLIIPFFFIHGLFMTYLPYRMLKRSVERLKYDLEREFYYLTKS